MGCHLDPAVMYCYAGNVELVLAVLVGLKGHTFMKGCGQEGDTTFLFLFLVQTKTNMCSLASFH